MDERPPLVLVACCRSKLPHAAAARDLYTSDLFKKSRAWAERFGSAWLILSAKHGVVSPDAVIEPYQETLAGKSLRELAAWGRQVRQQIEAHPLSAAGIVILAGRRYRGWAEHYPGVVVPMAGLGIGRQKAWLKAHLAGIESGGKCVTVAP